MKIKFIILILLVPHLIKANPVDSLTAKKIAVNTIKFKANKNIEAEKIYTNKIANVITTYTVSFKQGGYVVVSGDDATVPVFVYTTVGKYDKYEMPPVVNDWMSYYNESVYAVIQSKISNNKTRYKWDEILNNNFIKGTKEVLPLLTVKWGQSETNDGECPGFNYYVPSKDGSGCPCGKCPAGCVAVAMAQIMKYWAHPVYSDYGRHNWCNMPDSLMKNGNSNYETQRNEIARLIANAGDAVSMVYCRGGVCNSGALTGLAQNQLVWDFRFDSSANREHRLFWADYFWKFMLRSNLNAGMPVIYTGKREVNEKKTAEHAFVCDGYGQLNDDDYFHFNFGWTGKDDDYFYIDDIHPQSLSSSYSSSQRAIFNIKPDPDYIYDCNTQETVFQFYRTNPFLKNKFYNPFAGDIYTMGVNVMQGDEVTYTAHNGIKLTNFKVSNGGKFKASTQPCPSECGNVSKAVKEKLIAGKLTTTKTPANKNKQEVTIEQNCNEEINNIITIYPNPANNELNVKLNFAEMQNSTELIIYDMFGKKLASKSLQNIQNSIEKFNIRELHNGMYFIKINSGNLQETRKFLIQK